MPSTYRRCNAGFLSRTFLRASVSLVERLNPARHAAAPSLYVAQRKLTESWSRYDAGTSITPPSFPPRDTVLGAQRSDTLPRSVPLKDFVSDRFLREMHHFLWLDADVVDNGVVDAGWNCRDHALMVALLLQSFGRTSMFVHGEAVFARGRSGKIPGMTVSQVPHTWVLLDGVGAIDVSIKSSFDSAGEHFRLGLDAVFANAWIPRGKGAVHFVKERASFARAMEELPRRENHATAVYMPQEVEHVHDGHVFYSAGWAGSPLTKRLDNEFGDPCAAYAALLLHLRALLLREAPSLAGIAAPLAWRSIAASRTDAIARAIACFHPSFRECKESQV